MNNKEPMGFINIYKEKGYTSFDVVSIVRKTLNRLKVGHGGTLDPGCEGVLPICIGKATKLADYISGESKEYRAELTLGIETDTEDTTGTVINSREVSLSCKEIEEAVLSFLGEYSQIPPMYSAVQIGGKRLYDLARQGKVVERQPRAVKILSLEILEINNEIPNPTVKFNVACSKGTYIRTLCKDIGEKLGCGGAMSDLVRTRAGGFTVDKAVKLGDFKALVADGELHKILIPPEEMLSLKKAYAQPETTRILYNGGKIRLDKVKAEEGFTAGEKLLLFDHEKNLAGIYLAGESYLTPAVTLWGIKV